MDAQEHPGADPCAAAPALPPAHWTVLILRDVLGWSAGDTAALLGMTARGLDRELRRARSELRGLLPPSGQADGERAMLARFTGTTDAAVLSLIGALLRAHSAQPRPRSA